MENIREKVKKNLTREIDARYHIPFRLVFKISDDAGAMNLQIDTCV